MSKASHIEEIILIVKSAVAANATIDFDKDTITLDGNDLDHIAEQVAEALYEKNYRKQREGEWVYGEHDIPHCSECGYEPREISPYCQHCGTSMEGDSEE